MVRIKSGYETAGVSGMAGVNELDLAGEVDPTRPSIARVYDAFLGGKDNFEVDREVCRRAIEIDPDAPVAARDLRSWLIRVVRFLVGQAGIDQFLDCGSGLPTAENVHQAAQRLSSDVTVVYVDNDPVVAAHGRALLEENPQTHFVFADLRWPADVLANPVVRKYIDFTRPVALMQCATIHHVLDEEGPAEIMAAYIDALPPDSYVALSHFLDPGEGSEHRDLARQLEMNLRQSVGSGECRTHEEILSFLDGLELVQPGLVPVMDWWPDGPTLKPVAAVQRLVVGAVARKPASH
ncbi:SAM-dependent methyltransferase [Kibdelosporangium aridum]|uniref:SAM-dependent methyltransferase n=1 Tax=Kibdelosporangium aridum TaxID=2030 RepID=UPI0035E51532